MVPVFKIDAHLQKPLPHFCYNQVPEDTNAALEDKSHTLEDPQAKLHSVLVSTNPVLFARSLLLLRKKLSDFGSDALQMYVRNNAPKVGIVYCTTDMN